MCVVSPSAPSAYYASKSRSLLARALFDAEVKTEIQRVYDVNYQLYGVRKVWKRLAR